MAELAPLIVFSDDWGRHPSSCQHLISQLLPRRRVVWLNTIGTRPLKLNWYTVKRAGEKFKQWFSRSRDQQDAVASPTLRVINPRMWPSFRSGLGRRLNRRLLLHSIRPIAEAMPVAPIVITTIPLVGDLVGEFPASRWVYYCVDDFGVWPGLDGRTLRDIEAELVPKVDTVIAVSTTLQAHIAMLGKPAHLLTHGVDLEHFCGGNLDGAGGSVLFWGVIDRRMDLGYVRRLGERLADHGHELVFVGPQDDPDPKLFRIPGVRVTPSVPYEKLPSLAASASALIMPYADLPVTRAMQPLKLKEYLATGKPVVVRKLPATEPWADCCDVCDSPEQFADAVLNRLKNGVPNSQAAARERLTQESWAAKAAQFEQWISG
jgi:glycosyltransferase involved in cell wall biosynthesis